MLLYADPGTGTLILQLLGAFFVGALFYLYRLRDKIRDLISRRKK